MLGVNTATLKDNPDFGKALVGIWYETLALVADPGEKGKAVRSRARQALRHRPRRLSTPSSRRPSCSSTPKEAVEFTTSAALPKTMDLVRTFSFDHGLLGDGAKSKDAVGMQFPSGEIARQRRRT